MKTIEMVNNNLNNDQKLSYILNKQEKYEKTTTTGMKSGNLSSRVQRKSNPFTKDFSFNTQSKLRNHEAKRPHTSAVNHSRDFYDPINRTRANRTTATKGGNHPKK